MTKNFICPHCGAEVQVNAPACPECGSDDETGWSKEDIIYDEPSSAEEESVESHTSSLGKEGKSPVPHDSIGVPWITYIVIVVSTVICLYFNLGKESPGYEGFTEALAPSAIRIWAGAYWGLITSAFVHIAFWHILFNMWWARDFGRILEPTMGVIKYPLFLIASAIVSSGTQLAFSAQTGIGFSGVVYAMFGYGLAARHVEPRYRQIIDTRTVRWLLGWLIVCIILSFAGMWNVGNAAHVGGFLFGFCVGNAFLRRVHTVLCRIGLIFLIALSVLSVTYMPWSTTWRLRDVVADFLASAKEAKTGEPAAQYRYGQFLAATKEGKEEAASWFRQSAEQGYVPAMNDLAWMLATDQDDSVRNAAEAIEWARRACEKDGWALAAYIDTLAAAYAEADQWEDAVATQRMAIEKLSEKDHDMRNDFESRLQKYLNREKVHD
jgi:membrane associated rhomboid family serine protease